MDFTVTTMAQPELLVIHKQLMLILLREMTTVAGRLHLADLFRLTQAGDL